YHPGRQRWEVNLLIVVAAVAKPGVLLHEVVDAAHRAVIGTGVEHARERVQLADGPDDATVEPAEGTLLGRHAGLAGAGGVPELGVTAHDRVEAAFGSPDASALGMDV